MRTIGGENKLNRGNFMKSTKINFLFYLISIISLLNPSLIISQNNFFNRITFKAGYHSGFNPSGTNEAPTTHSSPSVGGYHTMSFPKSGFSFLFSSSKYLDKIGYINWEPEIKITYAGHEQKYSLAVYKMEIQSNIQKTVNDKLVLISLGSPIKFVTAVQAIGFYISLGPQLNAILIKNSEYESSIQDIADNYIDENSKISGKYNSIFLSGFIGLGVQYNKSLPFDLIIEARYSFDITNRFHFHYEIKDASGRPDMWYFSNNWELLAGFKIELD